jgi:hypothetical protein
MKACLRFPTFIFWWKNLLMDDHHLSNIIKLGGGGGRGGHCMMSSCLGFLKENANFGPFFKKSLSLLPKTMLHPFWKMAKILIFQVIPRLITDPLGKESQLAKNQIPLISVTNWTWAGYFTNLDSSFQLGFRDIWYLGVEFRLF